VLDPLALQAVSYALAGLLALAGLILSAISLKGEIVSGKPLNGLFPVVLIIAALCVLISLATAFLQIQRPVSILLRWERAAVTTKE
jgi:hypothetical protein